MKRLPFVLGCLLVGIVTAAPAATVRVDLNGGGDYETIQDGIGAAALGDTVLVAPGVYQGQGNVNLSFGGKEIVLVSEDGPDFTVIDCGNSARGLIFTASESADAVVGDIRQDGSKGFTIRNGAAPTSGDDVGKGGGMYCMTSGPVIVGCRFEDCNAVNGGAIHCDISALPQIISCEFTSNSARDYGGAIYCYGANVTLTKSTFTGNQSGINGGAISCKTGSLVRILSCDFIENHSSDGAGVYIGTLDEGGTEPEDPNTILDCEFTRNSANRGGALFINGFTWANCAYCIFDYNTATGDGGAVYALTDYTRSLSLQWCTLCFNESGGHGGGVFSAGTFGFDMTISHCVLAFGRGGGTIQAEDYGSVVPQYCVTYANVGGDALQGYRNVVADPLFCNVFSRNYHLCENSICLEANNIYGHRIGCYTDTYSTCGPCASPVERSSWGAIKSMYR